MLVCPLYFVYQILRSIGFLLNFDSRQVKGKGVMEYWINGVLGKIDAAICLSSYDRKFGLIFNMEIV